jgi:amidase
MDDLLDRDATALAELVRNREVEPIELVDAAIARIEERNGALNAVITPLYEEARARASAPLPEGPFTGVPFLLKDVIATYAGARMTAGSAFLAGYVPKRDSTLVRRLKAAGLIVVGKTNTPEFGILPTTEPRVWGPTRNPWDKARSTGGSSGGSAAAVAAGMVPMAHASDGGGSIRIPASCCGLFGLKPTRARNPLGPDVGDIMGGFVVEHAVTRSVRDSARLLDATQGPDVGDPYSAPPLARPFAEEVGADPGRLRIAFTSVSPTGAAVHPDCALALEDAARLCADLGHEVVPSTLEINTAIVTQAFMVVWAAGATATLAGAALAKGRAPTAADVEELTWALAEMGRQPTAGDYLMAVAVLQRVSRRIARYLEDHDLLLTPTLNEPPPLLGSFEPSSGDPLAGMHRAAAFASFTPMANFTGLPAMSVPLFWGADGLPIGAHFVARFGDEATLFRLAAQLERARPWGNRRPPR